MNIDPRDNRTRARRGKITLSVGPQSGDLPGIDDKALQAALDYLNRLGGGLL